MKEDQRLKRRRNIKLKILLFFAAAAALAFAGTAKSNVYALSDGDDTTGYTKSDHLNVYVGYYGMTMYTKGTFSISEMEALGGSGREIYTFIDKKPCAVTAEAEGIWLAPFLDSIGVDRSMVNRYHFDSADGWGGEAGTEFTGESLFEQRYSFSNSVLDAASDDGSNLQNFDYSAGVWDNSVWDSARTVDVMLATKAYWTRWSDTGGTWPTTLDFSNLTSEATDDHCLRLFFGEPDTSSPEASKSCFLVRSLRIQYSGYPGLTASTGDIRGDVGTSKDITITVTTPENDLSLSVGNDLTLGSSDGSIASFTQTSPATENGDGSVTLTGTVNFIAEGSVSLYANYNGAEGGITIGAEGKAGTGSNSTGGNGSGTGTGNGSGSGSGTGVGSGSDVGTGTGSSETGSSETDADKTGQQSDIYLNENAGTAEGGGGSSTGDTDVDSEVQTGDSTAQNWKMMEVKDDALTDNTDQETGRAKSRMMISGLILFAAGMLERTIRFYRQKR